MPIWIHALARLRRGLPFLTRSLALVFLMITQVHNEQSCHLATAIAATVLHANLEERKSKYAGAVQICSFAVQI